MKLLFLLITLFAFNFSFGQDFLEWSEGVELSLYDFKAEKPELRERETLHTAFWIESKLGTKEVNEHLHFNTCISNLFSREFSWIDKLDLSRLRYANTLFYLKEWETREMRKRLYENREHVLNGEYQQFLEEIRIEFEKILSAYDSESQNETIF